MPGIESYSRRDKDSPSPWAAKLEGANFQWARETIARMIQVVGKEAGQGEGAYVYKTRHGHALQSFIAKPCLETAIALLNAEGRLWDVFEQSKHPLIAPKMSPAERTRRQIDTGQIMPLIECGLSSIKLGLFTRLSRKFRQAYDPERAIPLAFCVTYTIFCEPVREPAFHAFGESNFDLIGREIRVVFDEEELSDAVLLAYAARIIALGWETHDPFHPITAQFLELATDSNKEIPDIVQMWGAKAAITFFERAQEFMLAAFDGAPGIESFGRRSEVCEDPRLVQGRFCELYQRALTTANHYIPLKLGPGNAPLAGMLLNHIFADEVLRPDNPHELVAAREFAAVGRDLLADRAKELLESLPVLRRALIPTLWIKRFMDLAHGKNELVAALDASWVFKTYSSDYPVPTIKEYEIIVRDFEEQFGIELVNYVSHASDKSTAGDSGVTQTKGERPLPALSQLPTNAQEFLAQGPTSPTLASEADLPNLSAPEATLPITQKPIPPEKIAQFIRLAQKFVAQGVDTPEKLVQALDVVLPEKGRGYLQAFWNAISMVNPDLSGTHDWVKIFGAESR